MSILDLFTGQFQDVATTLGVAKDAFLLTWWFWAFLILMPIFRECWLYWRQSIFLKESKYTLFEIKIPRELSRGARGMEQILQAIHGLRNSAVTPEAEYVDGEVTRPFSLEMVSFGGEIHLYLRTPSGVKSIVQAAFFSYYPEVEFVEVDDYVSQFPRSYAELKSQGSEMFGSELVLTKESAYPIRTYTAFETGESGEEGGGFDPLSTFLEVLAKLRHGETACLQLNIVPINDWAKKWEKLLEELRKPTITESGVAMKSPRQTEILKAVESNLSKPAFNTIIRFLYMAPKTMYADGHAKRGIMSAFNQYAISGMNSFRPNFDLWTSTMLWIKPYIIPATRNIIRKQRAFLSYINRTVPSRLGIAKFLNSHPLHYEHSRFSELSTETVATLFHPPTNAVLTAPHMRRTESKKTAPSAGLPIYGDEGALQQFQ